MILDGVIVQSKILLHYSPTLDTRVLSLRAWSKLIGVISNKPLSVCLVDDIKNLISSASDMALSCHVVGNQHDLRNYHQEIQSLDEALLGFLGLNQLEI